MSYPPSQKPPIWSIDPGVIAYNCQKAGMPHPVLAMPMWEGGGNLARDYSGHGNHGALIGGATWVAEGIDFNGTDGYVDFGSFIPVSGGTPRTIAARIKADSTSTDKTIMEWGDSGNGERYTLRLTTGGTARLEIAGAGETATTDVSEKWFNIIAVCRGDNLNTCSIYLNGGLELDLSTSATINTGSVTGLNIGYAPVVGLSRFFGGTIGYSIIFNTALSLSQVKFIHYNPYFMYQIPEELYGYTAAAPPVGNPFWYYNMLKRRN